MTSLIAASRDGRIKSRVAVVISDVPDAPALDKAREAGIAALWIDPGPKRTRVVRSQADAYVSVLQEHDVDLVCLAGFMRVIGKTFFAVYGGRIVNIHPSLLPSFRGLHGQRQALEAGVKIAGCSVHFVIPELDAGPVIVQAAVTVAEDDTEETLSERILEQEHRIYPEAVRLIEEGRTRIEGGRVRIADASAAAGGSS